MDAVVEDAAQDLGAMLGDEMEFLQGEFALVQLAVRKNIVDDFLHHALDAGRGGIGEGLAGRLHLVRHQHQACFLGLGPGPRITVVLDINLVGVGRLILGLGVEKTDEAGAVVLLDDVADGLAQVLPPGQFHPVLDVGREDQAAHGGGELFMFVLPAEQVLHKIGRFFYLADIVVISRRLGQQGVGADGRGRGLDDLPHHEGMVVGPGPPA